MRFTILMLALSFLACGSDTDSGNGQAEQPPEDTTRQPQQPPAEQVQWRDYSNNNYHFEARWPEAWRITATSPGEPLVAVNLYSPEQENQIELPLNIHTRAGLTHLSAYPKGWGTSLPGGKQLTLKEYGQDTPASFALDAENSYAFLLENGQAWGYLLHPAQPPAGWADEGYLFAQIAVEDFKAQCYDEQTGEPLPMDECDPMTGDSIVRRGQLQQPDARIIRTALAELSFFSPEQERKPLSDLIRVEQPLPNNEISSPLQITGEARGQWYFEGDFPVVLQDMDYNTLATGVAQAKGRWMTTDFVPFELTLEYGDAPDDERGYLLFKKSNASGKPEMDRSYRVPVLFPPKD